jgi:hypothetical protein
MRRCLFAAVSAVVVVLTVIGSKPAAAQGIYCLAGGDWGWPGLCDFSSYEQCMATASGTHNYCRINPAFAGQQRGYRQEYRQQYRQGYRQGYWRGY